MGGLQKTCKTPQSGLSTLCASVLSCPALQVTLSLIDWLHWHCCKTQPRLNPRDMRHNVSDIWSEWLQDQTHNIPKTRPFWKHTHLATLDSCDAWELWSLVKSMIIFMIENNGVTRDRIRNPCNVLRIVGTSQKYYSHREEGLFWVITTHQESNSRSRRMAHGMVAHCIGGSLVNGRSHTR